MDRESANGPEDPSPVAGSQESRHLPANPLPTHPATPTDRARQATTPTAGPTQPATPASRPRQAKTAPGVRAREAIETLAGRQHGVVARRQLLAAGLSASAIDARIRSGRLRRLHRDVYGVGPVLPAEARALAAVLACGPTAVVSHESAAVLWKIVGPSEPRPPIHVLTAGGNRSRPGIRVHRTRRLHPRDTTTRLGIPLTTVPRTLLDLAGGVDGRALERIVAEALAGRLTTLRALRARVAVEDGRNHRASRLRRLLNAGAPALTRSEAEERLLALLRKTPLPRPRTNARLEGMEVDVLWREARLVVEVDGRATHDSSAAFETDRRRDATLAAAGFRVVRVTRRQLTEEPEAVLVRLAQALARADGRPA